jgi:hypothetical protein
MEKETQAEQQPENLNSSEREKYESPQVTLCDIRDTSNDHGTYIDGPSSTVS